MDQKLGKKSQDRTKCFEGLCFEVYKRVSKYKIIRTPVFRLLIDQGSSLSSKVSFLIMMLKVMYLYVTFLAEGINVIAPFLRPAA